MSEQRDNGWQDPVQNRVSNRVKEAMDQSANDIDYATQLALARARANALQQTAHLSVWQRMQKHKMLWLGSAVPATLAVFFVLQMSTPTTLPVETHSVYEDLELLSATEDLETFSELEMYEWMSEGNSET
jgi:hypothetical protein